MTRFLVLAFVVGSSVAACSKSDAPAPAAKAVPAEAGKPTPTEVAKPTEAAKPATPQAPGAAVDTSVPPGRPAIVTDAHIATVNKLLTMLSDLGTMLEIASNCDRKAKTLDAAALQFEELAPELQKMIAETEADPATKTWFDTNYKPRMEAAAMPLMTHAASCKDDPGFMKSLAKFPMMKKKKS